MKTILNFVFLMTLSLNLFSQQTLFFDNFESYNPGDSVVNLSTFQGWGANGVGVAYNDPGNGANGSDQYFYSTAGYMVLQVIDSVIIGETYRFSMNGALTGWNQNGINFQIIQLHGPGNSDDEIRVDFTLGSVGSGQQNVFKLIDTSYTTLATDTSNLAFRFSKNWGPEYKIDNFKIECTSCPPPPVSYDLTLKVNASNISVGPNGIYAGGGFLGGSDALQLSDSDGDGTWEGITTVLSGSDPNYYAFFNSPNGDNDWGTKEDLSNLPCGVSSNSNDRILPVISSDTTIHHCFGSCESDGTCPTLSNQKLELEFVKVYPNPSEEKINISSSSFIKNLKLTDVTGKIIIEDSNVGYEYNFNVNDKSSSLYFLTIFNEGGINVTKIIVK